MFRKDGIQLLQRIGFAFTLSLLFIGFTIDYVSASVADGGGYSDAEQTESCLIEEHVDDLEVNRNQDVTQSEEVDMNQQDDNEQNTNSPLSEFEQEVVELTNKEREKNGLQPLQVDPALSDVAHKKSLDMLENHYFDHNSPKYGSPFDMMKQFGISYTAAGENIAQGQRSAAEVVQAWMDSPGHRENILNSDFTHIGVGFVEDGYYWTQLFMRK